MVTAASALADRSRAIGRDPTKAEILRNAAEVDAKYGKDFLNPKDYGY